MSQEEVLDRPRQTLQVVCLLKVALTPEDSMSKVEIEESCCPEQVEAAQLVRINWALGQVDLGLNPGSAVPNCVTLTGVVNQHDLHILRLWHVDIMHHIYLRECLFNAIMFINLLTCLTQNKSLIGIKNVKLPLAGLGSMV